MNLPLQGTAAKLATAGTICQYNEPAPAVNGCKACHCRERLQSLPLQDLSANTMNLPLQ